VAGFSLGLERIFAILSYCFINYILIVIDYTILILDNIPEYFIPWSRILPKNLAVAQLLKNFPIFYGTHKFITMSTSARHWFLS
jgi:hypothetical protein